MVGLIVPELQNPIFPALAEVVAGALAQRGFNAVLCTRTGSMSEAEYVDMLLERQVSGMIFAGGPYAEADAPHEHYARLLRLRLPVVLVNAAAAPHDGQRADRRALARGGRAPDRPDRARAGRCRGALLRAGERRSRRDRSSARPRVTRKKYEILRISYESCTDLSVLQSWRSG